MSTLHPYAPRMFCRIRTHSLLSCRPSSLKLFMWYWPALQMALVPSPIYKTLTAF